MQWVQEPSQSNVDNLNNVRREASRHFRNKRKGYLKAKLGEPETNGEVKNIKDLIHYRGISDFKKSYQHRPNIVKDEKGGLVKDFRLGERKVSLSCSIYMGITTLGRQKYTQQNQ